MTALEPTGKMAETLAIQAKADFTWALNRMVELLVEELGQAGGVVASRVITRLLAERESELARRNRDVQS